MIGRCRVVSVFSSTPLFKLHKMSFLRLAARAAFIPRASWISPRVSYQLRQQALFSSGPGLSREDIEKRVLNVFRDFDKVDAAKVVSYLTVILLCINESLFSSRLQHRLRKTWVLTAWMQWKLCWRWKRYVMISFVSTQFNHGIGIWN